MGHWSFNLKFGLMGHSLLFLHVLIKYPEINRNHLPVVIFTISKFFPYCFNVNFATMLPLTLNGALD